MLSTSMTIIFCVGIGGMMKEMGVIHVIVKQLAKLIRSTGSLILISEIIGYISQMLSGSHYFADVMLQSTMLDIYKEKTLKTGKPVAPYGRLQYHRGNHDPVEFDGALYRRDYRRFFYRISALHLFMLSDSSDGINLRFHRMGHCAL